MYQFILSRVNYSHKSTDVLSYITIIQTTTTLKRRGLSLSFILIYYHQYIFHIAIMFFFRTVF